MWVGIGFGQGLTAALLGQALQQTLQQASCWAALLEGARESGPESRPEKAIAGVASLDRKAQAPELWQLCHHYQWPLLHYSATQLATVAVPHPSRQVAQAIGTASVAEAAALLAARHSGQPEAILWVSKQVIRFPAASVTIALAGPPAYPGFVCATSLERSPAIRA